MPLGIKLVNDANEDIKLEGEIQTGSILINTALSVEVFKTKGYAGGSVEIPAWTDANVAFMVCSTLGGTYVKCRDDFGYPVVISGVKTAEAGSYKIPDVVFNHPYFHIRSEASANEALVNQAAARSLVVYLK